jgi:hypothetical protein
VSFIAFRGALIALKAGIEVLIGVWIKEKVRSCEASRVWVVVVVNGVGIEKFPNVICPVTNVLEPYRKVRFVQSLGDKFRIATFKGRLAWGGFSDDKAFETRPTIRRVDICDICIVGSFPSPQTDSGWAAKGNCTEVSLVESSLVNQMLLNEGHVVQRVHMYVLVIGQDKDYIGTLAGLSWGADWLLDGILSRNPRDKGNRQNAAQHDAVP